MRSGCLVHVRKATRPSMMLFLMMKFPSSFASNAIPPNHCIDILHLSRTFPVFTAAHLSSASQT